MEEIWKAIPGYVGVYEVSNYGRVRGLDRIVYKIDGTPAGRAIGKVLKQSTGLRGRRQVMLYQNRKYKCFKVHALVLLAFVGPRQKGMDCCHNDGDASNNLLSNLRYDTRSGNLADRLTHGTHHRGENSPGCKLTSEEVIQIRQLRKEGKKCRELGEMFGVHRIYISQICRNVKRVFN